MLKFRTPTLQFLAPLALVGALAFTGCAGTAAPVPDQSTTSSSDSATDTGTESEVAAEIVTEDTLMSGNDEFDAQLAQLSTDLKSAAAPGVSHVRISSYGTDHVGIHVWTSEETGVLTGAQLQPVLDALADFTPAAPIDVFEVSGWTSAGVYGEANGAAQEIGVKSEFIDNDWWSVTIPGDQVTSIFA